MAQELYTRTNQKLFFSGLALENWQAALADEAMTQPGRIQAEREACLFHLYGAVLSLLHEIMGFYRSPMLHRDRVETLISQEVLEVTPSPELAELLELRKQPDSWLSLLLDEYAALFQSRFAAGVSGEQAAQHLLGGDPVEDPQLAPESVEEWRQQLKAIILRFRNLMSEW